MVQISIPRRFTIGPNIAMNSPRCEPWGHAAFKVREKVFLFMGEEDALTGSVKLPESRYEALELPFTEPTHYGMGKHGWVSFKFTKGEAPPVDLLLEWIDESFRAVAPKKLLAKLDAEGE